MYVHTKQQTIENTKTKQNETNKTKQNKIKYNKTKQNKTKQNKTKQTNDKRVTVHRPQACSVLVHPPNWQCILSLSLFDGMGGGVRSEV
jgi:hypothetical protein